VTSLFLKTIRGKKTKIAKVPALEHTSVRHFQSKKEPYEKRSYLEGVEATYNAGFVRRNKNNNATGVRKKQDRRGQKTEEFPQ